MSPGLVTALAADVADHESRIRALERSMWWLFGAGAGIGMLALALTTGIFRALVGGHP